MACEPAISVVTTEGYRKPEFASLVAGTSSIISFIVAKGPGTIADSLVSGGLISEEVYQGTILQSKTPFDKARDLVQAVKAAVRDDPSLFSKFLEVVQDYSGESLVKLLRQSCELMDKQVSQLKCINHN